MEPLRGGKLVKIAEKYEKRLKKCPNCGVTVNRRAKKCINCHHVF